MLTNSLPVSEAFRSLAPFSVPAAQLVQRIAQVGQLLLQLKQWQQPADEVVNAWLRTQSHIGARDRAGLRECVFHLIRYWRLYAHCAESSPVSPDDSLAVLALSAHSTDDALASALEPVVWRWVQAVRLLDAASLPFALRHSFPDWLAEPIQALSFPGELAQALNQPAQLDLRVNPLKTTREALLKHWQSGPEAAFNPQPTPYSPWGIRLDGRPPVTHWETYKNGQIEIQDEGSQLLAALVAPGRNHMVIDYCAGGGGKSLLLGALMKNTGRLYAFDVSTPRLDRLKPRLQRSGLDNLVSMVIRPERDERIYRLHGKAQRVLVDAPCSGVGTLRRNPDLKWRLQPHDLAHYIEIQRAILQQASACVAPGGRLVYATCSLLEEENTAQVKHFLKANPGFRLLNAAALLKRHSKSLGQSSDFLVLRPDLHRTDGFFAAVLEKYQN